MKELTDNSTGISTSAINNCNDREQLLEWKFEINDAISAIKSAIEFGSGSECDEGWLARAKFSKSIKIRLRSYIDFRLGIVNRMIKEQNAKESEVRRLEWLNQNNK